MVKGCCVPGCQSRRQAKLFGQKVSEFSFPKNEEIKQLWLKRIQRENFTPTVNSVVCERHFVEDFIVRVDSAVRKDGSVLTVPRTKPKLTPDAFPSIFPGKSSSSSLKRVTWKGWKQEYLRVSKTIDHLQDLTSINPNLLELGLDLENFPEAKDEIENVRKLTQEVLDAKEVEFDFASQDLYTKMRYLDEQLTDMFSILTDQEFKSAFAGLMEMELTNICAFPAFLERLVTVKNNPELRNSSMQSTPLTPIADGQENATENPKIVILVKPAATNTPDRDDTLEVDELNGTKIEIDDEMASAVSNATSASQPSQILKNMLPFASVPINLNQQMLLPVAQNATHTSSPPFILGQVENELVLLKPLNTTAASVPIREMSIFPPKEKTPKKQKKKKCTQEKDKGKENPVGLIANKKLIVDLEEVNSFLSQTPPETVGENKLKCPLCKLVFTKRYIKRHILTVHWKKGNCLCPECGKILSSQSALDVHMDTHISDRKYDCDLCSKSLTSFKNFQRHKSLHRRFPDCDGKIYACSECPKRFMMQYQLRIHQRIHTGERPFACSKCPNKFISQAALASHFNTKHKNRTKKVMSKTTTKSRNKNKNLFTCSLCNAILPSFHTMSLHILKHPEHIRDCAICDETFESTADLHSHIKSIHLEDKPFQCRICSEHFHSHNKLNLHQMNHHSNKSLSFKCSLCDRSFEMKYRLVRHQKFQHFGLQVECEVCKKKFRDQSSLRRHRQTHGERKYRCNICEKTFSQLGTYQNHLWTHMETKRYQCDQCDKGFNDKRHLKSHIQKTHSSLTFA